MVNSEKPDRDEQVEIMIGAEGRAAGYFSKWASNPEFKEALHRNDVTDDGKIRRVAGR